MRSIVTRIALAALVAVSSTGVARAEGEATQFMKTRQAAVNRALAKKGDAAADALQQEIDGLLDYETLSRHALEDHWDARSPAERKEFVNLLRQLVERSYKKNLRSTLGYRVKYLGEGEDKLGTVVRTEAKSTKNKREPAVAIDYTLQAADGSFRVVDITTDGVSMVRNYRSQFNRILRKDGWDDLLRRMRERLKSEGDGI